MPELPVAADAIRFANKGPDYVETNIPGWQEFLIG
jgi:hypothetical protein